MVEFTSLSSNIAGTTALRSTSATQPVRQTVEAGKASSTQASAGTQDSRFEPRDYRLAKTNARTAIDIDLSNASSPDERRQSLIEGLTAIFKVFTKNASELESRVNSAADSLAPILEAAAERGEPLEGLQIGLARVDQFVGESGGTGSAFATGKVSQFAIEVGVVSDGKVKASDVGLVDLSGQQIKVTNNEQRRGITSSVYQLSTSTLRSEAGSGANNQARYDALLGALDRLVQVQGALSAYRNGDPSGLQTLDRLLRGEDPASSDRQSTILSRLRQSTSAQEEVFVPGLGVIKS